MKRLIIMRHAETTDNKKGYIHGNEEKEQKEQLTLDGITEIHNVISQKKDLIMNVRRMLVSPSNRTIKTAEIVKQYVNTPIEIVQQLREFYPGILAGLKKEDATEIYPNYMEIYKKRGDMDGIPSAEEGENVQARLLGFLMQYYDKEDYNDMIITHAGIIRILINMINKNERTTQFPIPNCEIFVINDFFRSINITRKIRAMNSKVFIIDTLEGKFVAKIKDGPVNRRDIAEQKLLQDLDMENLPYVLSLQNYLGDLEHCKVLKYIQGEHIYGCLQKKYFIALIESEKRLEDNLAGLQDMGFPILDIRKRLETIYNNSQNQYIRFISKCLLSSEYLTVICDESEYVLSHNDLNRDNILFQEENGEIHANIIDFEALEYSPKDYQFASMLISGLLLEGESIEKIDRIIQVRGKNEKHIHYLMQIRALQGLYFFLEGNIKYISDNKDISKDLLKRYYNVTKFMHKKLFPNTMPAELIKFIEEMR